MASPEILFQRAMSAFRSGQLTEAERDFRKVLRKAPTNLAVLNILAAVLIALKRFEEAEPYLKSALRIDARSDATHYNYGLVLKALGRPDEALRRFSESLALNPANAESWNNRGIVHNDLRDYAAALSDFDKAMALNPRYAAACFNRSRSLAELKRYDEALGACDLALQWQPDLAEASFGRGFIFQQMRRPGEAAEAYARAMRINPDLPLLKGNLLHQKMLTCDWAGTNELISGIDADLASGKLSVEPFAWQGIATTDASLLRCASLYAAARYPAPRLAPSFAPAQRGGKIRIGYLSGEFREQATSLLMAGVLEQHDRQRFEIFAFDNGFDDGSTTRRRIEAAVDGVVDIAGLSDPGAVAAIRDQRIDILVNLNGYFGEHRSGVFARRAAPLQVNYLGFPGTLGASYMDYIVADATVLPEAQRRFFAEKVVTLPNCYQANDDKKQIADRIFTREECGLPAEGFVFCCFNNAYKITPAMFDVWMRILTQVDGSVLWLLEDSAAENLRREAAARGIDPARLVFATRTRPAEHLARHRVADLFLDTLPYNAHTTASDALWAGLPLLTCRGDTFAGRVAASLLQSIDVPELIAPTLQQFERQAIDLATHPQRLSAIRQKLSAHRRATPAFNTAMFTGHLEAAYLAMMTRHRAGLAPDHLMVAG
ncbi:tetratricopeptide repeat protein [Tardiphaga sp.]|uniref:O-linked N-acetylglucosamine transferase, SPINDLY family protein n=1 Tax=Tardiphaga sp. TaxID=1926292 RepID=UPI0026393BE3|nr:tetratricopeptide repeat protein [Tardiphaga sp.]MDB5617898.1 repeat-containing protein [Tardiphaga sp.]